MKKKKKYAKWLGADSYNAGQIVPLPTSSSSGQTRTGNMNNIPAQMVLKSNEPGVFFGTKSKEKASEYIGMSQGAEGNILIVGGNGSGKSSGIAKPTLLTWQGGLCVTDIKGELSDYYQALYQDGKVTRPYIIFDPINPTSPSYDPFSWLLKDNKPNLVQNIWDITTAIIPLHPEEKQPFWTQTEQGIFAAALLHHFNLGLSFSETICRITTMPLSLLYTEITENQNIYTKIFLGETAGLKPELIAEIDRGLRNKIMLFAADPYIGHAFRGVREGATCFTWADLDNYNIFLRIPAYKIDQLKEAIALMYNQLLRHLERRPDKYSVEGTNNEPVLLLMDEFARFGKLNNISTAFSTLRSKNVNICPIIQSTAQLDKIYGEYDRRIIFDNCQFVAILRANDADTQKYLCELIGSTVKLQRCMSENKDNYMDTIGYSKSITEIRELRIFPHELSSLNDILLLTPYGFCRVEKFSPQNSNQEAQTVLPTPFPEEPCLTLEAISTSVFCDTDINNQKNEIILHANRTSTTPNDSFPINLIGGGYTTMLSIEERAKRSDNKATAFKQQQRRKDRQNQEAQKKKAQRQNYIIGESFANHFPIIRKLEPGTDAENAITFKPLEIFMSKLAENPTVMEMLSTLIDSSIAKTAPEENICSPQCISGQLDYEKCINNERR
jgi:hypothetical protein